MSTSLLTPRDTANSVLFTREQRDVVLVSNLGILATAWLVRLACQTYGAAAVLKFYGIPWLCVTHW